MQNINRWAKVIFIGCAIAGTSSASMAQSLGSIVEKAMLKHPEVLALAANQRAVSEELVAAKGLALPGVRVEGRKGWYHDSNTRQGYGEVSLVVRQPLFDGFKARSETNRNEERVNSARNRVADTANTIALQVVQAYLEVRRARIVAGIARENMRTVRSIVRRVNKRVSGGGGNRADLSQAKARLFAARNTQAEAGIRRVDAEALYLTITGKRPGKLRANKLPRRALPSSVPKTIALAMNTSPKILAMRHDALAAEHAIGTARSALLPTVDLELSANYRDRIVGTSAQNTNYKAMVVFKMSLYNGGINAARVREARHRTEEARNLADAAKLNVEREIRLAWNTYNGAGRKVKALKNQTAANRSTLTTRLRQYSVGRSSLISILDAQNEHMVARAQSVNEGFAGKFSFYKILAASGKLVEALNVTMPNEAGW